MTDPGEFLVAIADQLHRLGIRYLVGGSVASSLHGLYRTTQDLDIAIDPSREQLETLRIALEGEFYVSDQAVREAWRDRSTFNAIHLESSFKIDFFLVGSHPFDRMAMSRAVGIPLGGATEVMVASPEDIVLRKLEWFRRGGEASEMQWRDILNVLTARVGTLDEAYLDEWAAKLRVADLLARARVQVRRV